MLENNIYNIDRNFDYTTVRSFVLKSLHKIVKEALKKRAYISQDAVSDFKDILYPNDVNLLAPPTSPLLKLKIRNTKYLNWRLSIIKRDNFTCKMCHTSVKENKNLRLEVHHPKSFDEICNENNVSTVEQALGCEELWSMTNGVSICYGCHKDIEKLRTKLRNMFWLENA
jgi:hypothetical protein